MTYITELAQAIKPCAIRAYTDRLQVWIERPLSAKQESNLRAQCGRGGLDRLHVHNGVARFDPSLRQRLQLRQPSDTAIEMLVQRDDVFPNNLEKALDLIFASESERDRAQWFCDCHAVKHHHRGTVRYYSGTRYSNARGSANNSITYPQDYCRITGELNVLHFDWRITGVAALRRAGLEQMSDIINSDDHEFWSQRLCFAGIDSERLGRSANNRFNKGRRRHPLIINGYNVDKRTGDTLIRAIQAKASIAREQEHQKRHANTALGQHAYTIQDFLDNVDFDVRSCIEYAEIEHLLPRSSEFEESVTKTAWVEASEQTHEIYYRDMY
jgi:hypothetical protein